MRKCSQLVITIDLTNEDIEEKEKDFHNHDDNWFDRHLISIALLLLVEIVASVAVLHRISIPE